MSANLLSLRYCNTPYVTCHICIPTLAIFGTKLFYFLIVGFLSHVVLSLSCISYHVIMCIAFAYVFVSCIRAFSPLSVLRSGTPMSSGALFCLFSCAGVKLSQNGPRFAKRPWYSTCRPPVKFRAIWSPFGTPTVNRGTAKASCVLRPNTPPKWPNNPSKRIPCPPPLDRDRVAENCTPFGHSNGLCGCPVNRWSTKRPPNGTKLDR